MKKLLTVILLAILIAVGWRYLPMGAHIATGYSSKQLCSGMFVAGLPEKFVLETDINPRMAILGPAQGLLHMVSDNSGKSVESTFLGFSSTARYRPATGCTLNPIQGEKFAGAHTDLSEAVGGSEILVVAPPAELAAAYKQAFAEPANGGRNTLALLVMHKGELVAEQYLSPVTATTPLQGWSMNKSLIATWVGIQVKKGQLSLDQNVLQALQSTGESLLGIEQNVDPALTLFNLLHMESGFEFVETYDPGDDATQMLYNSSAMWRAAPENGHEYPPGEHFSYSSGDANLAAFLWQGSLEGEPYYR
ncbi:MAG: serine hydrolase [Proteobacteria bacterium]|nr:serine hydrolase [Pseudomonadota bacterium]